MNDFFSRIWSLVAPRWPYLVAVLVTAVLCLLVDPISRNDSHYWRMWLALVGGTFVLVRFALYRFDSGLQDMAVTALRLAMTVACTVGVFNYYQFDREVFTGVGDYTDVAYYYTNSKYLDELGYFGLYAAMLQADKENEQRHYKSIRHYRDLRDYELKTLDEALKHGEELRDERFSPARWTQFQGDADFFLKRLPRKMLQSNFFVDHGYNPPPTWTVVGGSMAQVTPVEWVKVISSADILLMIAMFVGIGWAFGADAMLFALLFALCTFSGRWPILGQSIMRFDWLVALVLSACMLKKGRYATAGGLTAYAALNRIFPAIFFFGWGATAAIETWRTRRLLPRHVRFALGALAVSTGLVGGAYVLYGGQVFRDSAHNLSMHNRTYSSHRVGLGDLIVFRGETTRKQINDGGGIAEKEKTIQRLQPLLRLAGLGALLFLTLYVWRTRKPIYERVHLAILPLYCITNAQINYYNLRLLLIMWHASQLRKPRHAVGLPLLLLVEVATQWTKVVNYDRYTTTTTTSIGLALYFAWWVQWMITEMRPREPSGETDPGSPS